MKTKIRGFTLVELMIVVAIIGIVAGIAIPSYKSHIVKSKRIEAQGALMAFANAMEQAYVENGDYCDVAATTGATVTNCGDTTKDTGTPAIYSVSVPTSGNKNYDLTIFSVTIADATATPPTQAGYTLRATPSSTSAQYTDGWLAVDNLGNKTCSSGNGASTTTATSITNACPNLNGTTPTW